MKYSIYTIIVAAILVGGFLFVRTNAQTSPQGDLNRTAATTGPATSGSASTGGLQSDDPARDILFLLNRLSGIVIKTEIFESKAFTSLYDFGLRVVPEPYGRPNPFAPIGVDSASATPIPITPTGTTPTTPTTPAPKQSTTKVTPPASPAKSPSSGFDDLNGGFFDENL